MKTGISLHFSNRRKLLPILVKSKQVKTVYLVGTDHRYQRGAAFGVSDDVFVEFCEQLKLFITQYHIRGIAEEMSLDGMGLHRINGGSLGYHLAREMNLVHAYCDPDNATRKSHDITSLEQREKYWLRCLEEFQGFPCLFILGALHVKSFSRVLAESRYRPIVLAADWKPVAYPTSV